jgi:hypothetical protein
MLPSSPHRFQGGWKGCRLVLVQRSNHVKALVGALSVGMLVGCHNQTSSFSNPFVAPDRVPPPSTQQLTPGTAQPYYPGGPVQPAPPVMGPAAGQPTVPPGTFATPPATGYQAPPAMPAAPTTSPSGWNSGPQPIPGSATRTPVYGGQPTSAYAPTPPAASPSAVNPAGGSPAFVSTGNPAPQGPVQTVLPTQYVAPAQYETRVEPTGNPPGTLVQSAVPQRPVVRELTAAELQYTPGTDNPNLGTDRFLPQGSTSVASGSTIETQPIVR